MDLISRQAAIELWEKYHPTIAVDAMQYDAELRQLPSVQPESTQIARDIATIIENEQDMRVILNAQHERDIPIKPIETTDKAWGIPSRQAVCPKCDHYLGHIAFLDSYKGKRVTYCETCGQAIDWEGWVFDDR